MKIAARIGAIQDDFSQPVAIEQLELLFHGFGDCVFIHHGGVVILKDKDSGFPLQHESPV